MSQRYEVTPGNGLVARHGDSILWVGPTVSPEVWDSLADLVTHHPGTDPLAGDTAAAIESILGPLSRVPGLSFAALLVADGQAQGVLYGPVTVRNASGPAPAHGYGPFGITIPFGLSEPVYVGFTEADSRPAPQGSPYLHLDAGVVPGSGMWMHPQPRGERIYQQHGEAAPSVSSASGSHAAMTDSTPVPDPALAPQQAVGAGLVIDAEQSRPPEPAAASAASGTAVPLPSFVQDALAGGVTAASGAGAASALAAAGMGAASAATPTPSAPAAPTTPATDSVESVQPFEPVQSFESQPAYEAPADEPAAAAPADLPPASDYQPADLPPAPDYELADSAHADVPPTDLPADASYAQEGQPDYAPDAPPLSPPTVAATAEFTPDLGPDPTATESESESEPEPWRPSAEPPASVVEPGFAPATDHLRIDLRLPQAGVHPLSPLPPVREMQAPAQQSPHGGVLVFDDGSTFSLDQDYVIGRKPERHALVQSGQARPLTVDDPDSVLSGAHAAVRLQGADVFLEDLGSLNGSHIALPGATEWTRVPAHNPVRLEPGTRLLFGWTVATFSGS